MALRFKSSSQPVVSHFELKIPLTFPGAKLSYSFGTDGSDIGFSVSQLLSHGEIIEIRAESRVQSHTEPLVGSYDFISGGGFVILHCKS